MWKEIISILKGISQYQGVITLLVGVVAFLVYFKQKNDYKRDAAKLILQEIRYAEQKIRKYREIKSYKLYDRLLPTNSWHKNIHLFIKDLKETEIDLISDFYAKASYIDDVIKTISRQKTNPPFVVSSSLISSVSEGQKGEVYLPQKEIPKIPQEKIEIIIPPMAQKILDDVSMSVEFIYNTPVVEKLRKIAKKKWYHIL